MTAPAPSPKGLPKGALKVQGLVLENCVSAPYNTGHVCSAIEANVLNQTRLENIRNNVAKEIREALDEAEKAGTTLSAAKIEAFRKEVAEYDDTYEFGERLIREVDPIRAIAVDKAMDLLTAQLRKQGVKTKDIKAADIRAKANSLVDSNPKLMEFAKKRHAQDLKDAELLS